MEADLFFGAGISSSSGGKVISLCGGMGSFSHGPMITSIACPRLNTSSASDMSLLIASGSSSSPDGDRAAERPLKAMPGDDIAEARVHVMGHALDRLNSDTRMELQESMEVSRFNRVTNDLLAQEATKTMLAQAERAKHEGEVSDNGSCHRGALLPSRAQGLHSSPTVSLF